MEPRGSLSLYAAAILGGALLLTLRGFSTVATGLCLIVALYAALLDLSYLFRTRKRRMLAFNHRRALDNVVRLQWGTIAVVGVALAQGLAALSVAPLATTGPVVQTLVVGWTVLWSSIYVSALVDWYWILPKVSGLVCPAPCTVTGGKTFDRMTGLWFLHRGASTAIVTFILAVAPAWIAGTISGTGSARALLTLLGTALAIGFNAANAGTVWALSQFKQPTIVVGWFMRRRRSVEDVSPEDVYVVDVSVDGVKYKFESELDGRFVHDGHLLPFAQIDMADRSARSSPICPSLEQCRGANWYCVRNRNSNGDRWPEQRDPHPLPADAPAR